MMDIDITKPGWIVLNLTIASGRHFPVHQTFADATRFAETQANRFPGEMFAVFSFTGFTRMLDR